MNPFPVLRLTAGLLNGAAGLILIAAGAFAAPVNMGLVAAGIALLGPMAGFFIGEANGRRTPPSGGPGGP